jgi:hypothetical protein
MPISHLLGEAVEGYLHFDSKSFRTIRKLAFNPGCLTLEFIKSKRAQYVSPTRLYIFISLVFFLLLTIPFGKHDSQNVENPKGRGVSYYDINSRDLEGMPESKIDSVLQVHSLKPTTINTYIIRQMIRIGSGGGEKYGHLLMKIISYTMFALMPVFGFFVYMLHRKKERWYVHTLVFSVHIHCFAFLLLMLFITIYRLIDIPGLFFVSPIIFLVYLFLALRHVYGDSKFITFLKTILIGIFHFISMVILFIATIFISIFVF